MRINRPIVTQSFLSEKAADSSGVSSAAAIGVEHAERLDSSAYYRPLLIVVLLVVAIMISALFVIKSAFDYRTLFNAHQKLVHHWEEYQVEWGQLLLEQGAWGGLSRIETKAETQLSMRVPLFEDTEIVKREN